MRLQPLPRELKNRLRREGASLLPPAIPSPAVGEMFREALEEHLVDPITQKVESHRDLILGAVAGVVASSLLIRGLEAITAEFQGVTGWASRLSTAVFEKEKLHSQRKFNEIGVTPSIGGFTLSHIVSREKIDEAMMLRVAESVSLISSIPEQYFHKLKVMTYEAVAGGESAQNLAEKIEALGQSTRRRARIIARDQVAKASGNMNQIRQEALGITEYVWQTAQDERVRPSHRVKHGKVFRWDSPPEDTGHPGQDYLCRCIAIGVLRS